MKAEEFRKFYRMEFAKMFARNLITSDQLQILVKLVDMREQETDSRAKRYYTGKLNQVLKGKSVDYDYLLKVVENRICEM